jgi:hypothetical protein
LENYSSSDKLFIYGAGVQANIVARSLIYRGIKFSGFVISSTQEKPKTLFKFGKEVFYPNELPYPHSEIAVYYGLSPENAKYVREYLKDNRIVFGCEFLENAVSFS